MSAPFKDTGTVGSSQVPGQRTTGIAPGPVVQAAPPPGTPEPERGGAATPKTPHRKEAIVSASNAAPQEPAEEGAEEAAPELPRRTRQPRGGGLAAVPAEPAVDAPEAAPETAPEATPATPEPAPKWPPIGPQLDREFPHLTGPAQDVFAGLMAFNGMATAHEAAIAKDNETRAVDAAILAQADQAHTAVRSHARYVQEDVCAYAAPAELARCPVHGTLAGTVMVHDAPTLTEVAAGRHHEAGEHPWLDTMALELNTDGEAATDG